MRDCGFVKNGCWCFKSVVHIISTQVLWERCEMTKVCSCCYTSRVRGAVCNNHQIIFSSPAHSPHNIPHKVTTSCILRISNEDTPVAKPSPLYCHLQSCTKIPWVCWLTQAKGMSCDPSLWDIQTIRHQSRALTPTRVEYFAHTICDIELATASHSGFFGKC